MRKLSLVITTYNRFTMTLKCIEDVKDDPLIDEILIVDDASDIEIYNELKRECDKIQKVKLVRNEKNLDCYANKANAVSLADNEWVILFDSDNIMTKQYIDSIYSCSWEKDTILAPTWAMPNFDYRQFEGIWILKENVSKFIDLPMFSTALNTHNMFVNRDEYLKCFDATVNPNTSDSIFMNTQWLENGNRIYFVPGLYYEHTVHENSHYKANCHKSPEFYKEIEEKLKNMK